MKLIILFSSFMVCVFPCNAPRRLGNSDVGPTGCASSSQVAEPPGSSCLNHVSSLWTDATRAPPACPSSAWTEEGGVGAPVLVTLACPICALTAEPKTAQ